MALLALLAPNAPPKTGGKALDLDPVKLFTDASLAVKVTIAILLVATLAVWMIAVLKYIQLATIRGKARKFERAARRLSTGAELYEMAEQGREAAGGRVVYELYVRGTQNVDRLRAVADRAIVDERHRARILLTPLSSIAAATPFVGLFGTVYGIIDAFDVIGAAENASLQVLGPKIGEALITTALGLVAAIPAVVFYNSIEKKVTDFVSELEASASEWVAMIADTGSAPAASQAPALQRAAGGR